MKVPYIPIPGNRKVVISTIQIEKNDVMSQKWSLFSLNGEEALKEYPKYQSIIVYPGIGHWQ
jgi:hypothetical protein